MEWQLQETEEQFSRVVQSALTSGPQVVNSDGKRAVVVLSAEEYDALKSAKPTFIDDLLSGPVWDDEFVEAVNARSKHPGRDIDF